MRRLFYSPIFVLVVATIGVAVISVSVLSPDGRRQLWSAVDSSLYGVLYTIHGTPIATDFQMVITRAEGCNMGLAAFIQANGWDEAPELWQSAGDEEGRYQLIRPYLAFSPPTFSDYQESGSLIVLPGSITDYDSLRKADLFIDGNWVSY